MLHRWQLSPTVADTERELRQDLWNMTIQRDYAERLLEESLSNEEILKEDASRKTKTVYYTYFNLSFARKSACFPMKQ